MATRPHPQLALRSLSELSVPQVRALIAAERKAWSEHLHWSLADSSELVEQAVRCGVLPGFAVHADGAPVGYISYQAAPACFRPCSAHVLRSAPTGTARLLVEGLLGTPSAWDRRFEGQITAFAAQEEFDSALAAQGFQVVPRDFLALALQAPAPPLQASARGLSAQPLERRHIDECARILVSAHSRSLEAVINTSFRTVEQATGYLADLAGGGGCGPLHARASGVAFDSRRRLQGFCLVTMVAPGVAHVPQVAVKPDAQGTGVGSLLLGRALAELVPEFRELTLSVSCANTIAADWYRRLGFKELTRFAACWRDR